MMRLQNSRVWETMKKPHTHFAKFWTLMYLSKYLLGTVCRKVLVLQYITYLVCQILAIVHNIWHNIRCRKNLVVVSNVLPCSAVSLDILWAQPGAVKLELILQLPSMAMLIFSHQPVLVQPAPKYISFALSNDAFKKYFKSFCMFLWGLGH